MEIGVSLRGVITGTPTICGVVRAGFGTPTHRRVLFATASARPLAATLTAALAPKEPRRSAGEHLSIRMLNATRFSPSATQGRTFRLAARQSRNIAGRWRSPGFGC